MPEGSQMSWVRRIFHYPSIDQATMGYKAHGVVLKELVDLYDGREVDDMRNWVERLGIYAEEHPENVNIYIIGWGMVNDMYHIEKYFGDLVGVCQAILLDVQEVAKRLGRVEEGLGTMVKATFGYTMDKTFQKADWHRRPLHPLQLNYAMDDALWTTKLFDIFRS